MDASCQSVAHMTNTPKLAFLKGQAEKRRQGFHAGG